MRMETTLKASEIRFKTTWTWDCCLHSGLVLQLPEDKSQSFKSRCHLPSFRHSKTAVNRRITVIYQAAVKQKPLPSQKALSRVLVSTLPGI